MSRLLIAEPPLQVLPTLACKIGLNEAIVLQQIHYWLDTRLNKNFYEGKLWVHNSLKSWLKQFPFFSSKTLQRTLGNLEGKKLLFVGSFHKNSWDRTKWYSINYDALDALETSETSDSSSCGHFDHMHLVKATRCTKTECTPAYSQGGYMDKAKVASSYREQENTSKTKNENEVQPHESFRQEELTEKLFSLWQQKIGCRTKLTSQRAERLRSLVIQELGGDITKWTDLLMRITRTPFLMGINSQKWRITLEWVLKLENYAKVRDGHYDPLESQPHYKSPDSEDDSADNEERISSILQASIDPQIQLFLKNLRQNLGDTKFLSWFDGIEFRSSNNQIYLDCSSKFKTEYLLSSFSSQMRQAFQAAGFDGMSIQHLPVAKKEVNNMGTHRHADI